MRSSPEKDDQSSKLQAVVTHKAAVLIIAVGFRQAWRLEQHRQFFFLQKSLAPSDPSSPSTSTSGTAQARYI
jgi:hypothetical protein